MCARVKKCETTANKETTNQTINQPTTYQPKKQPTNQTKKQPSNQSINQLTNQSTDQEQKTTYQPTNHLNVDRLLFSKFAILFIYFYLIYISFI